MVVILITLMFLIAEATALWQTSAKRKNLRDP
jgi:hypothetical protein